MKYRKIEKNEFNKLKKLFPGTNEMWSKYQIKRFQQFDNSEIDVFIIEDNDVIGEITVNYANTNLESETILNKRVYFEAFRISKNYQGKGLGQKLLEYTINYLKDKGYTEFTIGVEDDNEIANHIYSKFGFNEIIDHGTGDEFDPCNYSLYIRR